MINLHAAFISLAVNIGEPFICGWRLVVHKRQGCCFGLSRLHALIRSYAMHGYIPSTCKLKSRLLQWSGSYSSEGGAIRPHHHTLTNTTLPPHHHSQSHIFLIYMYTYATRNLSIYIKKWEQSVCMLICMEFQEYHY